MSSFKQFIFQRFNTLGSLFLIISISLFLLMLRLKLTESFYLLFLVWNLFLTSVPFFISNYVSLKEVSKIKLLLAFVLWMLFVPNAPYIVTDLIHLQNSPKTLIWYDVVMISTFAATGLYLYFISTKDILRALSVQFGSKVQKRLGIVIPFLTGFGIYLGRFLRWNSWDILQNPTGLAYDIFTILVHPIANNQAWIVTLGFGFLLLLGTKIYTQSKVLCR